MAAQLHWGAADGYTNWGGQDAAEGWGSYQNYTSSTAAFLVSPGKQKIDRIRAYYYDYNTGVYYKKSDFPAYSNYKLMINNSIDLPATLDSTYIQFVFNNSSKQVLCEYIRDTEKRAVADIDISLYAYVTANKTWVEIGRTDNTIQPHNTTTSIAASASLSVKYTLQNPVVLNYNRDDYYTQYTYPSATFSGTVDWMTKNITVAATGNGWVKTESMKINFSIGDSNSIQFSGTITQPAAYLDSFVGSNVFNDSYAVRAQYGLTFTNNYEKVATYSLGYHNVYKFINFEMGDAADIYRADSSGALSVDGDYIGVKFDAIYNPMHVYRIYDGAQSYNCLGANNPLTIVIEVKKLVTRETVYAETIVLDRDDAGTPANWRNYAWVSKDKFQLGAEESYYVDITVSDLFRTRRLAANIGTKPAFIEWTPDGGHMAIGKYVETEGLEIQFPTVFMKDVYFIAANGLTQLGEVAAAIPYTDTHSIGASNVQEALNWIIRRIS